MDGCREEDDSESEFKILWQEFLSSESEKVSFLSIAHLFTYFRLGLGFPFYVFTILN